MSHWHLTTGELTLLVPLVGAPVGALITIIAQSFTNAANLDTQKQLAESALKEQRRLEGDRRLWTKRSDVFGQVVAGMALMRGATQDWTAERALTEIDIQRIEVVRDILRPSIAPVELFAPITLNRQFVHWLNRIDTCILYARANQIENAGGWKN